MTRLVLLTRDLLRVFDGRECVAKFTYEPASSTIANDIEWARTAHHGPVTDPVGPPAQAQQEIPT